MNVNVHTVLIFRVRVIQHYIVARKKKTIALLGDIDGVATDGGLGELIWVVPRAKR